MAGLVILAFGLYRAHAVQATWALCIAAGAVLLGVGAATESEIFAIVGAVVTLVGVGSTGLMVLGETDEEWEHTPGVRGLPAAGRDEGLTRIAAADLGSVGGWPIPSQLITPTYLPRTSPRCSAATWNDAAEQRELCGPGRCFARSARRRGVDLGCGPVRTLALADMGCSTVIGVDPSQDCSTSSCTRRDAPA